MLTDAQKIREMVQNITCFALDMDGTIYLGDRWIDGARDFLDAVIDSGRKYCFLTNNSSRSADVYVEKLHRMGLEIDPDTQLVTSGHATIAYLKREYPGRRVYLLANEAVTAEFRAHGIEVCEEGAEMVVTTFDNSLDYGKMTRVCDYVRDGLPYIATHPDFNCPTETGFVPDIGAISAFIEASAGRRPDLVVGKPNREIIDYTLRMTGTTPDTTAMVGDRLYTDVNAGVSNGLTGILVLTGEATLEDVQTSDIQPHIIVPSVKDLIAYL